jgi:anti-anti-sigma factor
MHITGDDFEVLYDPDRAQIIFTGKFRLQGNEYAEIAELLNKAADSDPELITLDLRDLRFLNSSGINTLSKFVIRIRKRDVSQVLVKGSAEVPWQKKSLRNLQRLKSDLVLELGE